MRELNLLFITNDLFPYLNACSEIVYRLANELGEKYSCQITILGYREREVSAKDPPGIKTICIHSITKFNMLQRSNTNRWLRLLKAMQDPECLRYYLARKTHDLYADCKEYQYAINKALKSEKYDCIIGFSNPFDSLRALSRIHTDVPYIAYKLDPSSNAFDPGHVERGKKDEKEADLAAAAIITTDLIRDEYPENTEKEILGKIHVLQFPNIIRYTPAPVSLGSKEKIHCVFTGSLYPEVRNPRYTLQLFEALRQEAIVFHIFGKSYCDETLPENLPENVIHHGLVTSDEAIRYMQGADILVNIGNTRMNQIPSKLLTYISLGKPILNIIKDPKCPTIPYMEKYPMKLNLLETTEPTQGDIMKVHDFLVTCRGRTVTFDRIEKLYEHCTPEYVGRELYNVICRLVKQA